MRLRHTHVTSAENQRCNAGRRRNEKETGIGILVISCLRYGSLRSNSLHRGERRVILERKESVSIIGKATAYGMIAGCLLKRADRSLFENRNQCG